MDRAGDRPIDLEYTVTLVMAAIISCLSHGTVHCTQYDRLSQQRLSFFYRAMQYVHSAVLRSHVVCLSVRPPVCLSVCDDQVW